MEVFMNKHYNKTPLQFIIEVTKFIIETISLKENLVVATSALN